MRLRAVFSRGCTLALLVAPSLAAGAQSAGDRRAAIALQATPLGAFTPLMTPAMIGRRLNGAQFGLRYGLRDDAGDLTHAVAAAALFELGTNSSVTLTAGVSDGECDACTPALVLGVGGDMRLLDAGGMAGDGTSLHVSVSGDVGYAKLRPGDNAALTLGVGAPVTLSITTSGATGMRVVPYVVPVFGIGQIDGSCGASPCDRSGTRFVLGGGIGVWNPLTSVSASLGVTQVMLDGAKPLYGVNVVFGGR